MTTTERVNPPGKKYCNVCDSEIREFAKICTACKAPQVKLRHCSLCKELIRRDARICNNCKSYQGWRRHFVVISLSTTFLALLATLIAVISGMNPLVSYIRDRDSNTRFKVTGSSASEIYLKVWNTGRKPSTLLEYRLRFDRLPLPRKEVMLELSPLDKEATDNVIAPGIPARIRLSLPIPDTVPKRRASNQLTPEERKRMMLRESPMTVEIDVEESNDEDGQFQTRKDRFSADRIAEFIKEQRWRGNGQ